MQYIAEILREFKALLVVLLDKMDPWMVFVLAIIIVGGLIIVQPKEHAVNAINAIKSLPFWPKKKVQ